MDSAGGELFHDAQQVGQRTPEAVQSPHHQGVTVAQVVQAGGELRAVRIRGRVPDRRVSATQGSGGNQCEVSAIA